MLHNKEQSLETKRPLVSSLSVESWVNLGTAPMLEQQRAMRAHLLRVFPLPLLPGLLAPKNDVPFL